MVAQDADNKWWLVDKTKQDMYSTTRNMVGRRAEMSQVPALQVLQEVLQDMEESCEILSSENGTAITNMNLEGLWSLVLTLNKTVNK